MCTTSTTSPARWALLIVTLVLTRVWWQVQYDHPSVPVYYQPSLPVPRPQLSYRTPPTIPHNVRYHQNVLVPANPYLHEAIPEWLKVYFKVISS